MDIFLGKVTQQAMNYAIRSGITITAGYALRQSSRLLKTAVGKEKEELQDLQERLNSKIKIISPAIDMIELISARGNTSLESAVSLTKSLRWEIQSLGQHLSIAANAEEVMQRKGLRASDRVRHEQDLREIIQAIRKLLTRIEDAVPLINLAITASGASLSSTLPTTVSPSRLLQASTFLTAGDSIYGSSLSEHVQIGPTFTLSLYMLFAGHSRAQSEEDVRQTTWKEVIHKADVRLMRVPIDALYMLPGMQDQTGGASRPSNGEGQNDEYFPPQMSGSARSDEYAYQLVIVEDLDDDRVHSFEQDEPQPGPYGDVNLAGIREALPIHELSKIFYADTGKILNIGSEGEANSPILLLKRDPHSVPPRRMMDRHGEPDEGSGSSEGDGVSHSDETNGQDEVGYLTALSNIDRSDSRESTLAKQLAHAPDPWRLPPNLDPEWMAFEVFTEAEDSDDESEAEIASARPSRPSRSPSVDPAMLSALSRLSVQTPHSTSPSSQTRTPQSQQQLQPQLPPIRTSLSLLETLLRLLSLQQFQQAPHLSIPDELLTFFLSESASTGAASNDLQERKRIREETKRTVGFDPYDESPIKRRGEEYQYRGGESTSSQWDDSRERYGTPLKYGSPRYDDEGYDTHRMSNRSHSAHGQQTPHTPPLALKNLSKSSTPETPSISNVRRAPARRWTDGYGGLGQGAGDAGKKGSPLARPGTGITDEGIGTSPASINEETMS